MKLVTRRMTLMALEPGQVVMLARNDVQALERDITLTYHAEPLDGRYRNAVVKSADKLKKDDDDYLWSTLWMFNLGRELIGCAYFKGPPKDGTVGIGYGLNQDYWGNGYSTEAVGKLTEWALRQPEVKRVVAVTEISNCASQKVLTKNGFTMLKETDSQIYYYKENS